jgi:hypothetical protein
MPQIKINQYRTLLIPGQWKSTINHLRLLWLTDNFVIILPEAGMTSNKRRISVVGSIIWKFAF